MAKKNRDYKAIADAIAVAENTLPKSMPADDRMDGLTASMYAIVINTVMPAVTSVSTSVPLSLSLIL